MNQGVWIPKEIEDDPNLTLEEKHILAIITSFEKGGKLFFEKNATLAEQCCCSPRTITRRVQALVKNGYITSEELDGRRRILRSRRAIMAKQGRQDGEAAQSKCPHHHINNYTYTDNICVHQTHNSQEETLSPPSVDEVREYCESNGYSVDPVEFCDYYDGNGWMTGVNPVHDWRAVVRSWHRRGERTAKKRNAKTHNTPEPRQLGNSFETDDFLAAALKRSIGENHDIQHEK